MHTTWHIKKNNMFFLVQFSTVYIRYDRFNCDFLPRDWQQNFGFCLYFYTRKENGKKTLSLEQQFLFQKLRTV